MEAKMIVELKIARCEFMKEQDPWTPTRILCMKWKKRKRGSKRPLCILDHRNLKGGVSGTCTVAANLLDQAVEAVLVSSEDRT